jgi:hypothetical protein
MQVVHFDNLASGFIVIASDGVWEFIDSQQAVDLIAKFISKGSTVCTRPLRTHPSVNSQWCETSASPRTNSLAEWPPQCPCLAAPRHARQPGGGRCARGATLARPL